jgi:hypothetical protein
LLPPFPPPPFPPLRSDQLVIMRENLRLYREQREAGVSRSPGADAAVSTPSLSQPLSPEQERPREALPVFFVFSDPLTRKAVGTVEKAAALADCARMQAIRNHRLALTGITSAFRGGAVDDPGVGFSSPMASHRKQ